MQYRYRILFFSFFLLVFQVLSAQTGSITGTVKDRKSGETIVGANILIQGTTTGASSNLNGEFTIPNLKRGTYNVVVSFISYKTVTIENVKVAADRSVSLTIEMDESVSSLEGVTVAARRMTSTDISLISSIKNTDAILSGITAQQISRSQDRDASEVVRRIPGVTVVENRFIMIRGLSERYNSVLLNDAVAPGMEADVRSFSFDIIPSSLIERVLIFKSPSADLPGDFSGGVVKIQGKSIPDDNYFEASYSAGVRQGTSFQEFRQQEQDGLYWTGINTGRYDLPAFFPTNLRQSGSAELIAAGRSLPNAWVPLTVNAGLNQGGSVTGAFRINIGKATLGNITSLTYSNSKSKYSVKRYDYNQYDPINQRSSFLYNFDDEQFNSSIRVGILHNWSLRISPHHSLEFKNLLNQLSQSQYIHRTGTHYDFGYVADNHSFSQIFRGIYSGQLLGKHTFLNDALKLDWLTAYTQSHRDEPDYRRYRSDVDTVNQTRTLYIPVGAAASYFLGRFYSNMQENSLSGSMNLTWKPGKSPNESSPAIKAGVYVENKERSFDARNIGYAVASIAQFNSSLQNGTIDALFHPDNINNTDGIRIDEQSNPSDSYSASNKTLAGYILLTYPMNRRINAVAGLRAENNQQELKSFTLTNNPVNVNNTSLNLLPSVNLTYNLSARTLIRLAYGITVNRPEFRELAPFGFYDFNYNLVKKGNENLQNSSIHNIDLRWELYPTAAEMITAGVFFKKFLNPIETLFVPGGGSGGIKDFTFGNAESATSMGLEVEVRRSLAGITTSRFIDDLSILFNTAIIKSTIELGPAAVRQSDKRPMQGQSPFIVNAGLFYKNMKANLQASVQYNVIGKRIFAVGYDVYPDIYEMPRNLVDITLTKGLGRHFELKAGISDILNSKAVFLQDANQDNKFSKKEDQIIQSFKPGFSFNLGISYKI